MATSPRVPTFAGVYHLKLPVRDLARSRDWYRTCLGYEVAVEFVEEGQLMGYGLRHPDGGPKLGLRLDAARAEAAAGFDYFSIAVPDKAAIDSLAAQLIRVRRHRDHVWVGDGPPVLRFGTGHGRAALVAHGGAGAYGKRGSG